MSLLASLMTMQGWLANSVCILVARLLSPAYDIIGIALTQESGAFQGFTPHARSKSDMQSTFHIYLPILAKSQLFPRHFAPAPLPHGHISPRGAQETPLRPRLPLLSA